jgi:hypothetical protein
MDMDGKILVGRLPESIKEDILGNPDAVYISTGKSGRLIFLQDGNIVVTEGPGVPSARGSKSPAMVLLDHVGEVVQPYLVVYPSTQEYQSPLK